MPTAGADRPSKLNAVMGLGGGEAAAVTVTTYACVEPSAAVTTYVTGRVKSLAVTPLVWEHAADGDRDAGRDEGRDEARTVGARGHGHGDRVRRLVDRRRSPAG